MGAQRRTVDFDTFDIQFQQLLTMVFKRTPQLDCALDQRVVGYEAVRPDRLHELLLSNQAPWISDQVFQCFIDLGAELHFLCSPQQASAPYI